MNLLDLFIVLCVLVAIIYTYTTKTITIIETYRGQTSTMTTRLKKIESQVKNNTSSIRTLNDTVEFIKKLIGYENSANIANEKTIFQRLTSVEEEMSDTGDDEDDGFEYEFPSVEE